MKLLSKYISVFVLIMVPFWMIGQSPKAPLSRVINVPGTAQIAPSLSGDGKHMIFTTTANLKSELLVHYSYQSSPGKWTQPEPVTVINRSHKINHLGGYTLSYDGNYIFFTSRKTYGIGKYDIWYSKKTGANEWSAPANLGKPVNSTGNEGCPSLSTDGQTMYFVRCKTMDQKDGKGCVLMMAEKKDKERWDHPKALPDHINNGNILSPRISPDNETLIYAKGEGNALDLYQVRKTENGWSQPVALDYVNTSKDERFVSVPGQGDVLYYSSMFQGTYDIIKAKIPEAFQPKKIVLLRGEVLDRSLGQAIEAFIQLYDIDTKKLIQYYRTTSKNGSFEFFIPAGKKYDFSVIPLDQKHTFYSEVFDLTELSNSTRQKLWIELEPLSSEVSFQLNGLQFENDSTISELSSFEMSRLFKLLKSNPRTQIEIAVHRDSWEIDSTEQEEVLIVEEVDSLIQSDSVMMAMEPPPDPTEVKAQAIVRYLQERGVPHHLVVAKGYADTKPIAPNDSDENRILNRRVEVRIL